MTHGQLEQLNLSLGTLQELRRSFSSAIASGLARDGEQIKALRTFLRPPNERPALGQRIAVIDVGGTNCRAALLQVAQDGLRLAGDPIAETLPVRGELPLGAEAFFDFQADLLARVGAEAGLPLGYCFSYPTEVQPNLDARLIRWTKGVELPDVVGQLVGTEIATALGRRGLAPASVAVLNDTVACLLGAALDAKGPAHQAIGLIAGTGTNMAGFFDAARAPKLAGVAGLMALNLESGNFCPPTDVLTGADDVIDRSDRPGAQRFEKAASGHYLPYLFCTLAQTLDMIPPLEIDPAAGCGPLVRLMSDERAPEQARALVRSLFDRSADMVAVGLAALLDHYESGCTSVLAEGALFWRTPGYADRVTQTLGKLVGAARFSLHRRDHVNLVGAACAAVQAR